MHERGSALAVRVRFARKPRQVVAQLVVHTLNVVGVCFALGVALGGENFSVRRMLIRAVLDMAGLGQLLSEYLGCCSIPVSQRPSDDLVACPIYCPPQPDAPFLLPTKLHISSISTMSSSCSGMGCKALPSTS